VTEPAKRGFAAPFARAAIRLLRDCEPERALAMGAALGRSWVRWNGPRTQEARVNLALAFPDRSEAERREIALASFENLGRSLAEVVALHGRHRDALIGRVDAEGLGHLDDARAASPNGGVLVLTAHFGSWELGGAAFAARGYPITSVHRARGDPGMEEIVAGWREASGQEVVALGRAGIGVLRALRRGRVVLMLGDQNARAREGIFSPFFGVPASTRFGPVAVAARLAVPIVPVFIHRIGESGNHIGRVHPPLVIEPEPDDPEAAAAVLAGNVERMNRAIETAVRSDPTQWMWAHRRFRTRPPGEARLYPARRGPMRWLRHALR